MATTMTVSEARAALHDLLERVRQGEEVTLTRHGEAVAVVLRPDMLRARSATSAMAGAEKVAALLAEARSQPGQGAPPISARRADELVAAVRSGRERR